MRIAPCLLLLAFLISSCKNSLSENAVDEGIITYQITYLENNLDKVATPILPKKMTLKFNHQQSVSTIDGFLGFLKIISITNFREEIAQTYLKVFENEFVFIGDEGETICCYNDIAIERIEKTESDKELAGFETKKANVYLTDGSTITVYYTNDVTIKNPNATNPYAEIDGVLLDFQLTMSQLKMQFTANNFEPIQLKSSDFEVYENPKRISRDSMTKIMGKLME